jgi:glycerophosphoryl diester phosphodiesterase
MPKAMTLRMTDAAPVRALRKLLLCALLGIAPAALAFDVQGHRGARGLAPENTLAAFRTALELGVSTLELDVGLTRDGEVVIAHDRLLNPDITRDARGQWLAAPGPALHTLTLAEVQAFDVGRIRPDTRYAQTFAAQKPADGERMPTLAALFELVKARGDTRVRFNIETKLSPRHPDETATPVALVAALLAVVERHGMTSRVAVQSFDWRTLKLVQQRAPAMITVALTSRSNLQDGADTGAWTAGLRLADHDGSVPRLVKAAGARVWSPTQADLTPALLAEARALGLKVIPWTVNAPDAIERFIDWQVDGLISDHPERVLQALARRGIAPAR